MGRSFSQLLFLLGQGNWYTWPIVRGIFLLTLLISGYLLSLFFGMK